MPVELVTCIDDTRIDLELYSIVGVLVAIP